MWKPPERIRHPLPEPGWPTAEYATRSRLFQPITLGSGLVLASRTWVPAMVPWRATAEGEVTAALLEWYGRYADGRPGAIVVEATGIRDVPSGPLLRIGDERFVPGLRRLVDVVRQRSNHESRVFIQLIDFLRIRRRPSREAFLGRFLEITDQHRGALGLPGAGEDEVRRTLLELPDDRLPTILAPRELEALRVGLRERVTDTEQPHIAELPQVLPGLFADAAERAMSAGFDGVELHFAHAYTMASLLSALNTRADGYGGSREHRVRLPLEVYRAVRRRVGAGVTVGCRMLCDEIVDGGSGVDDASWFATRFAEAGMDFISLSTGGKFEDAKQPRVGEAAYPYTGPSGYECMPTALSDAVGPFGRQLPRQAAVRAAIRAAGFRTPVVACGGVGTFRLAERTLTDGLADIVAAARQSLADPDWWLKVRRGLGQQVRRCVYSNYCEALDQRHKAVTCQLWDRRERDAEGVLLSQDGKRRLSAPLWRPAPVDADGG